MQTVLIVVSQSNAAGYAMYPHSDDENTVSDFRIHQKLHTLAHANLLHYNTTCSSNAGIPKVPHIGCIDDNLLPLS
jgi:hypothetical protein